MNNRAEVRRTRSRFLQGQEDGGADTPAPPLPPAPPPPPPPHGHYYTVYYFTSADGLTWQWASRIDQTAAMPPSVEGPCEPTLVQLRDGRLLTLFRLVSGNRLNVGGSGGGLLWKAYSHDAKTWTGLASTPLWSVWPQAVLMSTGILAVSSGRPGVGLWLSQAGDGEAWEVGQFSPVVKPAFLT